LLQTVVAQIIHGFKLCASILEGKRQGSNFLSGGGQQFNTVLHLAQCTVKDTISNGKNHPDLTLLQKHMQPLQSDKNPHVCPPG